MIYDSITELIGGTPLLRLNRYCRANGLNAEIIAKLLVQEEEIDIFRIKPGEHFVNGIHRFSLAILAGPQFCCNPDFFTGYFAFFYCRSNATFILIGVGCINMPVA